MIEFILIYVLSSVNILSCDLGATLSFIVRVRMKQSSTRVITSLGYSGY